MTKVSLTRDQALSQCESDSEPESFDSQLSKDLPFDQFKAHCQQQLEGKNLEIEKLTRKVERLTKQKAKLSKAMAFAKTHDFSTPMLNRYGFEIAIKAQLSTPHVTNGDCFLSVVLLHLSNGQRLQARLGKRTYEQVLVDLMVRINVETPEVCTIARLSTDEIALSLFVPSTDEQYLPNITDKLLSLVTRSFEYKQQEIHLHAYCGLANSHHSSDPVTLINYAYHASVTCKTNGNSVNVYSHAIQEEQNQFNQLEGYLLQAVRNDDLLLYFQPKVDLVTNCWIGAEVLLRWRHPILGDMSNEPLIHLAEQNGLIIELGYFVLHHAMECATKWVSIAPDFRLSINISAKQICSSKFAEKVIHLLKQFQLSPHNLEFELTESCVMDSFSIAQRNIETLKDHGIQFALDDFGTGYASFYYLKKLPFDAIKIDKEFIDTALDDPQDKTIFRSIISIAKKLNKQVVTEGIETLEQSQFVTQEGCDVAQGYFYAKPMPLDVFETQLANQYPPRIAMVIS
ncbi:putative bifunctional diguanylate cyclase/phosphodiesterase [Vibrio hippocampi]|uniref:EAL domain-containing protein n=1 Tax=Vibrio hippocampi TaxID=654686 RepID=A0ABM8ZM65_9VIBR|nr:bifunctional diguanylate cyclase/phosphodiesterase [Vibrio hippocampi]CAH0529586.1 hypothetical protein VHP8226_03341 [Vibrio hippocampi]